MKKKEKVIIIGGGIAGLTAAHELIERDFDVHVYERRFYCGGKAASVRVDLANVGPVPGEHGFRFFPGWYRHLPDTLGRIPSDRHRGHRGDKSVLDHLVTVGSNLLASYARDPISIVLHAPRSADQAQKLLSFVLQIQKMGLSLDDALLFFRKLMEFLSLPDDARRQKYDSIAWSTFVDVGNRTPAFRVLTSHTRTLVAAKATDASAYTIATMAVRTLFESSLTVDRVLDGPTSEVWIGPWVRYLEGQGVDFHHGYELDSIQFAGSSPNITDLRFSPVDDRYVEALRDPKRRDASDLAEWHKIRKLEWESWRKTEWLERRQARRAKAQSHESDELPEAERVRPSDSGGAPDFPNQVPKQGSDVDPFVQEMLPLLPKAFEDKAEYYVFAIPIEQMAYFVNRSTMMTYYDDSLRNIIRLSGSVDWMTGIQLYFRTPINLEAGHIVCADSEWALTAIDQTQFWRDTKLPDEVQSVLSVDISAWDKKGRFNNKEAFRCTRSEIAKEAWAQLRASFNGRARQDVLQDAMLIRGQLAGSYHLDDNVGERYDRIKQAEYNRAQTLRFSADERLTQGPPEGDAPFIYGERLEMN